MTEPSMRLQRAYLKFRKPSRRSRAEAVLAAISGETAAVSGGDFFRSLLRQLASAFQVRQAFVTECTDRSLTRVRTIALFDADMFQENVEYDLTGTPCQGVIGGAVCYYPRGLEQLFSKSVGMQSYIGVPLRDSAGHILGHLALVDEKPMALQPEDQAMLEIFAARAGMELERKYADEALRQSEQRFRELNEQLADYTNSLEEKVSRRTREIEQRREVAESLRNILAVLNANRPMQAILDHICATACQLLGSQYAVMYQLTTGARQFNPVSASGAPLAYFKAYNFLSGLEDTLRSGQPAALGKVGAEPTAESPRALMAVPLLIQMEVSGCLALFYQAEQAFSKETIDLALAFGDQVSLILENASLRQRARQAAVIAERARLARDLHDSVTQSLYSLTLLAEGWQRQARAGTMTLTAGRLAELGEIAQQALKEMRLLVFELRPSALEQEGLLGALEQRLSAVEKRAGVETTLEAPTSLRLPAPVEEGLYNIAQEALNNVIKHAAATRVTVRIFTEPGWVTLEIRDNGHGFVNSPGANPGGIGLSSMRERAEQLGGRLDVHTEPGRGTRVRARIKFAGAD